jgi:ubiquitin-activating enzyme E1
MTVQVVVAVDRCQEDYRSLDAVCRSCGAAFVVAESRGALGTVFCDFGSAFRVLDSNGEEPIARLVDHIANDSEGTVTVTPDARHGFSEGDTVAFSELQGLEVSAPTGHSLAIVTDAGAQGLGERTVVRVVDAYTFCIGDTSDLPKYRSGGSVREVKKPVLVSFLPFEESVVSPEFVPTDFVKVEALSGTHLLWRAFHQFQSEHKRAPRAGCRKEARELVDLAQALGSPFPDLGRCDLTPSDSSLHPLSLDAALRLGRAMGASLAPMASVVGALAASEVTKACSGKFMPIRQWLHVDASECLPPWEYGSDELFAPALDRYDGMRLVFGEEIVRTLSSSSWFVVGAGAIGCEMLKLLALLGVSTDAATTASSSTSSTSAFAVASVTVTDMDRIEKSNLSRQFLFRPGDVGMPKSAVAADAVRKVNPHMRVNARELRVGAESEDTFDEGFWTGLSGVLTALDNVQARLYVDERCVEFQRALLDSGTLGTKGNFQCVLPHLTVNYGATRDPEETSIPVVSVGALCYAFDRDSCMAQCTLKNFPNKIEHTLQWSRDWFEGAFQQTAETVNAFLEQDGYLASIESHPSRNELLERIQKALARDGPLRSLGQAAVWAREEFEGLFHNPIRQLLHTFPPDSRNEDGSLFWSGQKRQPSALVFDPEDSVHQDFIVTAATLRGGMFGLYIDPNCETTRKELIAAADRAPIAEFHPQDRAIARDDAELAKMKEDERGDAITPVSLPPREDFPGLRLTLVEFEKDDPLHMKLVTAAGNLRARNYKIEEVDQHKARLIAGKIIPAIATTTALVVGFVGMELLKLVQTHMGDPALRKDLAAFRDGFVNLALPLITLSEPVACKSETIQLPAGAKYIPAGSQATDTSHAREWRKTLWDRLELCGPMTLQVSNVRCEWSLGH